jgi:hypothetical protein
MLIKASNPYNTCQAWRRLRAIKSLAAQNRRAEHFPSAFAAAPTTVAPAGPAIHQRLEDAS